MTRNQPQNAEHPAVLVLAKLLIHLGKYEKATVQRLSVNRVMAEAARTAAPVIMRLDSEAMALFSKPELTVSDADQFVLAAMQEMHEAWQRMDAAEKRAQRLQDKINHAAEILSRGV